MSFLQADQLWTHHFAVASPRRGTAVAAPPPSGLATLPSVGAVP